MKNGTTITREKTGSIPERYFVTHALNRNANCTGHDGDTITRTDLDTTAQPAIHVSSVTGVRNLCMMHLLERVAKQFNRAGIPLLVLKGAALNLTLCRDPNERPMGDLDVLVRPQHAEQACTLLEQLDAVRGEPLVRDDFFPRFYYEAEYTLGEIYPIKIDLHVRPFRPLRYAQLVPNEAFWQRAKRVPLGQTTVLVPCVEDMLIHLAVHAAIHGGSRTRWLEDIKRWIDAHRRTPTHNRLEPFS